MEPSDLLSPHPGRPLDASPGDTATLQAELTALRLENELLQWALEREQRKRLDRGF